MKKIALAGLVNDPSVGDKLLIECAEYLCKKQYGKDVNFVYIDLYGRKERKSNAELISQQNNIQKDEKKSIRKFFEEKVTSLCLNSNNNLLKNHIYNKQFDKFFNSIGTTVFMKKYFDERLDGVDLLIFAGGATIKYDIRVDFSKYYRRVLNAAKERNIPIVILSMGVESKYNSKDARCQLFAETLSDDSFKLISTRDNIDELKKYIINPSIEVSKIADIGVWSAEVYNIKKSEMSDTIGIGVIAANRFVHFKSGITPEQYDNAIVKTIQKLESRGEKIEVFNTGDYEDEEYSKHICELLGKDKGCIRTAESAEEIVDIISRYKGIISSRLHSCIPAYSLDIPFVAISWNNKLRYFAENINVAERVIEKDRLDSDIIIEMFDKALAEGYDDSFREQYKKTDLEFLDKCLKYIE